MCIVEQFNITSDKKEDLQLKVVLNLMDSLHIGYLQAREYAKKLHITCLKQYRELQYKTADYNSFKTPLGDNNFQEKYD
jgi:hypothetical protein